MFKLFAAALLVSALFVSASPTLAVGAPYCRPGEVPTFHFGFATLRSQLGSGMGSPTECEHTQVTGNDPYTDSLHVSVQATTAGMAYYVPRSNTVAFIPTFGATPQANHDTWAIGPGGLLYFWQGSTAEPPATAVQIDPGSCDTLTQADPQSFGVACFEFYAMGLGNPVAVAAPSIPTVTNPSAPSAPVTAASQAQSPALGPSSATPPSNDQLHVTLSDVNASIGDEFPVVSGQVCNQASSWDANEITIDFVFYDRDGLQTADDASYTVDQVNAGECHQFTADLTALQPWRKIGLGQINWTWRR